MNSPTIQISVKRYGPSAKSIDNYLYKIQSGWIKKTEKSSGVSILVKYCTLQEMKKIQRMNIYDVLDIYLPLNRVQLNEKV
jgi:hypothetical protein